MRNKIFFLSIGMVTIGLLILLPNAFERRIVAQGQGEVTTSDSVMYTLLAAVLSGGAITVAGSFLATYMNNKHTLKVMNKKDKMEREARADEYLKNRRIEVYADLWKHTKTWAKYYRGEEQKYEDAKMLFDYLHYWYFDVGGMFLSGTNRDRLFHLKDSLVKFVEAIQKNQADAEKPLPKDKKDDTGLGSIEKIVDECHDLRTGLSEDVGVRKDMGSQPNSNSKYHQKELARNNGTADPT